MEATAASMVNTVKVHHVSLKASQQDIKEFFSFSGDILHVDMQSGDEVSQVAYITFKDNQGAERAMLLTGSTIVDMAVVITPDTNYQLPAAVLANLESKDAKPTGGMESALRKAEDIVGAMLAKGFVLGKDALEKAKAFDEKHQLTSTATAKASSIDKRIGLSEKINTGTSAVNEKVKEIDQKYQVSEKTKSALVVAEQTVSTAGSAIMNNRYVLTGAAWVTDAFNKVATAATDATVKEKEKLMSEQQHKNQEGELAKTCMQESNEMAVQKCKPKHQEGEFVKSYVPESPEKIKRESKYQDGKFVKTHVSERPEMAEQQHKHQDGGFAKTDIPKSHEMAEPEHKHQEGEFTKTDISKNPVVIEQENKHQEGELATTHTPESPVTIPVSIIKTISTSHEDSAKVSPPVASPKKPEPAQ